MDKKELRTLRELKDALVDPSVEDAVHAVVINNPAQEVENSLVSFLTYRLSRLKESIEYEDQIKAVIASRIGEATFAQLIVLLEAVQGGNIGATRAMLTPFLSTDGKTLPENLREGGREDISAASKLYESTDDKKLLQAFNALNHLVDTIKEKALPGVPSTSSKD